MHSCMGFCLRMRVHLCAYMRVCVRARTTGVHVCAHACAYVYLCVCVFAYTYVHVTVCACVSVSMRARTSI